MEKGWSMKNFNVSYDTDVGIKKKTNQDSILLKGGAAESKLKSLLLGCCFMQKPSNRERYYDSVQPAIATEAIQAIMIL